MTEADVTVSRPVFSVWTSSLLHVASCRSPGLGRLYMVSPSGNGSSGTYVNGMWASHSCVRPTIPVMNKYQAFWVMDTQHLRSVRQDTRWWISVLIGRYNIRNTLGEWPCCRQPHVDLITWLVPLYSRTRGVGPSAPVAC